MKPFNNGNENTTIKVAVLASRKPFAMQRLNRAIVDLKKKPSIMQKSSIYSDDISLNIGNFWITLISFKCQAKRPIDRL